MLAFYISDLRVRLSKTEHGCWEVSTTCHRMNNAILRRYREVEATLHCVMLIQEAAPLESNQHLSLLLLFGPEILGQLPISGGHRVQHTMLGLIGKFSFVVASSTLLILYK